MRRVETPEAAEAERFLGSPTVRVNGNDVDPGAAERSDYGLQCRMFQVGGRLSPVPSEDWIRRSVTEGLIGRNRSG